MPRSRRNFPNSLFSQMLICSFFEHKTRALSTFPFVSPTNLLKTHFRIWQGKKERNKKEEKKKRGERKRRRRKEKTEERRRGKSMNKIDLA